MFAGKLVNLICDHLKFVCADVERGDKRAQTGIISSQQSPTPQRGAVGAIFATPQRTSTAEEKKDEEVWVKVNMKKVIPTDDMKNQKALVVENFIH